MSEYKFTDLIVEAVYNIVFVSILTVYGIYFLLSKIRHLKFSTFHLFMVLIIFSLCFLKYVMQSNKLYYALYY